MVDPALLPDLLGLEHPPAAAGAGVLVVVRLDEGGVGEEGGGGWPGDGGVAGPAVQLAMVGVGGGGAQQLGADGALVAALVMLLTAWNIT